MAFEVYPEGYLRVKEDYMWILIIVLLIIMIILLLGVVVLPQYLGRMIKTPITDGSLEHHYNRTGMYEVETKVIKGMQGKDRYILYYPKAVKGKLPAVVWGNGTAALPPDYEGLHRHLASWGFAVINTFNSETGTGEPLREALEYLLSENENQEGFLYERIDTDRIGCAGHSQGSTGAINLHTNYAEGNYIKTIVSIALPALRWCDPEDVYVSDKIMVPFLVLSGTLDFIIAPAKSCRNAIDCLKPEVEGWFLEARYSAHTEIQPDGGKYRGIMTAWFRYQLLADEAAGNMFDTNHGEILTNAGWRQTYHCKQS